MAPVKFDSAKVKYAFQSKAVETSAKLKLQNKLEFSLDHRLNGNTFKVGVSHKKFSLDYDTAGKVASAKFKHTINSSSKFSISQKVANHNWKAIPSPELEFELALVESSNYNDKLELKYGFSKHSGNIEYKAKFGGKHKCGVAADTVSKLDGANAYWRTKLMDSGLVTSVGGSFSKNEGPKLKLKSKPFSGLKVVAVGSVKTKSLDVAAEIKPKKISDKITLELGTVVSKSGKLSNTTASAKLSF